MLLPISLRNSLTRLELMFFSESWFPLSAKIYKDQFTPRCRNQVIRMFGNFLNSLREVNLMNSNKLSMGLSIELNGTLNPWIA